MASAYTKEKHQRRAGKVLERTTERFRHGLRRALLGGSRTAPTSGVFLFAPVRGEPGDGFEALYRALRAVGTVLGFLRLGHFHGVEQVVERASDLSTPPGVGVPEAEDRHRERGNDAEEEERALHPGEDEEDRQGSRKDAGEREVLLPLIREVRRQAHLAPGLTDLLNAHLDAPRLQQGPIPREVERPAHDPEFVARIPHGAEFRLAPELEA